MIENLEEKKAAAHALVDEFFDAGKELMVLPVPPDLPDEDKPALALMLRKSLSMPHEMILRSLEQVV